MYMYICTHKRVEHVMANPWLIIAINNHPKRNIIISDGSVWLPQELAKNLVTKVVIYRQGNKLGQEVSACIANIVTGDSNDNLTGQCQPK